MKNIPFIYIITLCVVFLALLNAVHFLVQTGQPSADVIARTEEQSPRIRIVDFKPGTVLIARLNEMPIVIWRRSKADIALAAKQNDPKSWKVKYSKVLGYKEPVYADDENLTVNAEWFFAVARTPPDRGLILAPRQGDFHGFFGMRFADHYDLSGRIRHRGQENLTIVKGELSEDGETIQLYLPNKNRILLP